MFGGKPAFGVKPLAQPVIWDRVRNQSLEPGMGVTEGARPYAGGANAEAGAPQWQMHSSRTMFGQETSHVAKMPSGVQVTISSMNDPAYGKNAEIAFHDPQVPITHNDIFGGATAEAKTTKQAVSRLSDVFRAMHHYVQTEKPDTIHWSAGSDSLMRVYDKVAPLIAKQLGGTLETPDFGDYVIRFKDAGR